MSNFLEWLKHFTHHAKPYVEEVLLTLDNYASHISLVIYDHCEKSYIQILRLPTHISHRMQPLDIYFFEPLEAAYRENAVCS